MFGVLRQNSMAATAFAVCAWGGAALAQTAPADIEEHFAIASKHYGDGKVQMHTRRDLEAGSKHSVFTINCKEQTYRTDYESDAPPETFPMADYEEPSEPMTGANAVATAAAKACDEHGHPLLEWRW